MTCPGSPDGGHHSVVPSGAVGTWAAGRCVICGEFPRQTQRWRAEDGLSYMLALAKLLNLARDSGEDISLGPASIGAMGECGLVVTGADLNRVNAVLEQVPGLYPSED